MLMKFSGENGHYDACYSITQHYNTTTEQSDLFIRLHAYHFKESSVGWNAVALGRRMTGALMFILYGDPTEPHGTLTTSVRSANGHHPPLPLADMDATVYGGHVPDIEIVKSQFIPYTGSYTHHKAGIPPSHVAVAEIIIRDWTSWQGVEASNTTNQQPFIWSSNFKQDFQDDFSYDRAIEMHQFGLGFGFLWVDIANAETPEPMFGAIKELEGHKGVSEIEQPPAPTDEEFAAGAAYIASMTLPKSEEEGASDTLPVPVSTPSTTPSPVQQDLPEDTNAPIVEPVRTFRGYSIRSLLWHLHGLLMILSFLVLYPLGAYFIRSGRPTAFNLHWTVQALGTVSLFVGALVGYVNSRSISIWHQYIGIFLTVGVLAQVVLGWRHHVAYLQTHSPTILGKMHRVTGRIILPLGFVNIVTGLLLRGFGWFTITLVVLAMIVEVAFLVFVLVFGKGGQGRIPGENKRSAAPTADEAEEYFQLAGDDDDGEFTDEEEEALRNEVEKKREERKKLAALDRV